MNGKTVLIPKNAPSLPPGFLGTLQLVFGEVFKLFGYLDVIGIITAIVVEVFCFGTAR